MNQELVKKSSVLLLAVPQLCNGAAYNILPELQLGFKEKVRIVVLNCPEKAEIKHYIAETVNSLAADEKDRDLFNQILKAMEFGNKEEKVNEQLETTLERNYCVSAQPHKTMFMNMNVPNAFPS